MKATEKVSQETMPWSINSTKAVNVKDSKSPKLQHHTHRNTQTIGNVSVSRVHGCTAHVARSGMKVERPAETGTEETEQKGSGATRLAEERYTRVKEGQRIGRGLRWRAEPSENSRAIRKPAGAGRRRVGTRKLQD